MEYSKQQLRDALEDMRANASDPQRVYSCLVRAHDLLGAQPSHAETLLNSVLSRADNVALLQELLRLHLQQEEIQWCLCRVLTLACSHSVRFQCQAGQLELWSDVFGLRSAHPTSLRVLESSLQLYEALLHRNEFHSLKARPAQRLIDEMLATIDRFSSINRVASRSSESFRPEMVVGAVRVLAAVYLSPRIQGLVEEKNKRFGTAIVSRLMATSAIFLESERDVRLWLQLCRSQIQQHRGTAVSGFFLDDNAPSTRKRWFSLVLDKWSTNAAVMYDFVALLTLVFAVPHELGANLVGALASELLLKHDLLGAMCELLVTFCRAPGGDATAATTKLEIVRALRQWSAVDATRKVFAMTPQVTTLLVPTLVEQLQIAAEQLRRHAKPSSSHGIPQQTLQLVLEVAIVLQQLPQQFTTNLRSALASSTLRQIGNDLSTGDTTNHHRRDTALDALVTRELTKLEALLHRSATSVKASLKKLASSKQRSLHPPSRATTVSSSTLALRTSLSGTKL